MYGHDRPADITVGQEVFIAKPGSWDNEYTLGKVSKVSTSGQVTVDVPSFGGGLVSRRFTPRDREVGGSERRCAYLAWNVSELKAHLAETTRLRKVEALIDGLKKIDVRHKMGAEEISKALATMREILDRADAALNKEQS